MAQPRLYLSLIQFIALIIICVSQAQATTLRPTQITTTTPTTTTTTPTITEKNYCAINPCLNGGSCTSLSDRYVCACTKYWYGDRCTQANHCADNPCQNGGACTSLTDNYYCTCPSNTWSGQNCTVENYCASNPCQHGGFCTSYADHFSCNCNSNQWGGHDCSDDIEDNCLSNPCRNGAWCTDDVYKPLCTCTDGWAGDFCDTVSNTTSSVVVNGSVVAISTKPGAIHDMFTKFLTVNCTFSPGPHSEFTTIMSILLSKTSSTPGDTVYSEVASLTSFSGNVLEVNNTLGGKVTGHIEAKGESYITVQWFYPSKEARGQYKCEAFGIDNRGHSKESHAVATVTERYVDLAMVLEKMVHLDKTLDELKAFKKSMSSRLTSSMNAIMEGNGMKNKQNGHSYYLSKPVAKNVAACDAVCRLYGGYLVEINGDQENQFVDSFVNNVLTDGKKFRDVAVGAKDEEQEGTWKFLNSGAHVFFFDWSVGQPNGGYKESCMYLSDNTMSDNSTHVKMFDDVCYEVSFNRFMCEFPF